jgi:hypothetical protein
MSRTSIRRIPCGRDRGGRPGAHGLPASPAQRFRRHHWARRMAGLRPWTTPRVAMSSGADGSHSAAKLIWRNADVSMRASICTMHGISSPQSMAFLWPALMAESASEFASAVAREFVDLAIGPEGDTKSPEPQWTTPNQVVLEFTSVRLRNFSTASEGVPTLVCAPFALHGATITDFAAHHSLIAALQGAGLTRVFVTRRRSSSATSRRRTRRPLSRQPSSSLRLRLSFKIDWWRSVALDCPPIMSGASGAKVAR